jgi:autotransporter-associated beta strand protein
MATSIWTGASPIDANFTTPGNWSGNIAPSPGDDLQFPVSAANLRPNNNFASGTSFNSITFTGVGGGYNITGTTIDIGAGGITTQSTAGTPSTAINTIATPLVITASNVTFSSGNNSVLTLGGPGQNLDLGSYGVTVGGVNKVSFAGSQIIGSGTAGVTVNMTNTTGMFELDESNQNTYPGLTTVSQGVLAPASSGSGNPALNPNSIPGELDIGNPAATSGSVTAVVRLLNSNQIVDTAPVKIYANGRLALNTYDEKIGNLTMQGGQITTAATINNVTTTGNLILGGDVWVLNASVPASIAGHVDLGTPTQLDSSGTNYLRNFYVTVGTGTRSPSGSSYSFWCDLDITATVTSSSNVTLNLDATDLTGTAYYGWLRLDGDNLTEVANPRNPGHNYTALTGQVVVNAGTLIIDQPNSLGASAGTTVDSGGTLWLHDSDPTSSSLAFAKVPLTLNGTGDTTYTSATGGALRGDGADPNDNVLLTWPGSVTLASDSTIAADNFNNTSDTVISSYPATLKLSGQVTGGGALYKDGPGMVQLTNNNNNYSGWTEVVNGILEADCANALGNTSSGTDVWSGAALQLKGTTSGSAMSFAAEPLILEGSGTTSADNALGNVSALHSLGNSIWTGTVALYAWTPADAAYEASLTPPVLAQTTCEVGVASGYTLEIDGTISDNDPSYYLNPFNVGRGSATGGNGTVLLTSANTYGGATTVQAGILAAANPTALGTPAGTNGNPPPITTTTVKNGATLELRGTYTFDPNEALTLNGTGVNNIGALQNNTGTNTWAGTITLATASYLGAANGTYLLITGAVGGGSGIGLTKVGAGTAVLAGNNTYLGTTTVTAGILGAASNTALGAGSAGVTAGTVNSDGTINAGTLQLGAVLPSAIVLPTYYVQQPDGTYLATPFTMQPSPLAINYKGLTLNGSGAGGIGALNSLSGNNTWSGPANNNGNAINLGTTPTGNTISTNSGATLTVAGTVGTGAATNILTINANGDTTFGNAISGSAALWKEGSGTLYFTGNVDNTYSGVNKIDQGTLNVNIGGHLATRGTLTIAAGATVNDVSGTLQGDITINGSGTNIGTLITSGVTSGNITLKGGSVQGTLTIFAGKTLSGYGTIYGNVFNYGTVNPGTTTVGTLQINGNFTQYSGGALVIDVNASGGSDQLAVTGSESLDPSSHLTINNSQGTAVVSDTIANLPEGHLVTVNGVTYEITYVGGFRLLAQ